MGWNVEQAGLYWLDALCLVVDYLGRPYVVYWEYNAEKVHFCVRQDDGTWDEEDLTTPDGLPSSAEAEDGLSLTCDNSHVHCAFISGETVYLASRPLGETGVWSYTTIWTPASGDWTAHGTALARLADGSGIEQLYMVEEYLDAPTFCYDIHIYQTSGGEWVPHMATGAQGWLPGNGFQIDADGNYHVLWSAGFNEDLTTYWRLFYNTTELHEEIYSSGNGVRGQELMLDADGVAHYLWFVYGATPSWHYDADTLVIPFNAIALTPDSLGPRLGVLWGNLALARPPTSVSPVEIVPYAEALGDGAYEALAATRRPDQRTWLVWAANDTDSPVLVAWQPLNYSAWIIL